MKQIGEVTHYYGNIGVAIVKLSAPLAVGETVHFEGGAKEFDQEVSSIQIEHEQVEKAKKGDVVGLKVSERIREGAIVSKE